MKIVPLKKPPGFFTVVDDADFDLASSLTLHYRLQAPTHRLTRVQMGTGYVQSGRVGLHRIILEATGEDITSLVVDHKDGWGMDNRRSNLRAVTTAINSRNRRKTVRRGIETTKSGFHVYHCGENLGKFTTHDEAVDAKRDAEVGDGFITLEQREEMLKPVLDFLEQCVRDGILKNHFRGAPMIENRYRIANR